MKNTETGDQLNIQYIGHSGFLVTTESCSLLFDYYTGELPVIFPEKPLYIFSSHRHPDHFNPDIFSFSKLADRVEYLLSYDIKLNSHFFSRYPEAVQIKEDGRLHSMKMDERYVIDNLEICTIQSTDEGVAFLVSVIPEQKLIYHAGDLNWWVWPDDTKQEYNNMTSMFCRSVERLVELVNRSGGTVDAAFIPLDPRQETFEFYGMKYYLEHVPMKAVFPMHFWEQYDIIPRFIQAHGQEFPASTIHMITERGQRYEI